MSPDRTTLTRADALRLRKENEDQRRDQRTADNVAKPRPASTPKANRPAPRSVKPVSINRDQQAKTQRRYDIAMSTPHARTSFYAPPVKTARAAISLPHIQFGPRWFSFLIAIFCVVDLYMMLNMDPFIVRKATIQGTQRLNAQEIENAMGAFNQSATLLNPSQLEYNLLASFPDISSARVEVNLPASLVVTIKERTPVAVWSQDGQTVWIDAEGFAFAPRGEAQNLVPVAANGAPPAPLQTDSAQTIGAHRFISSELASAITALSPSLPQGASLIFDPQYGLGWNDPSGWQVFFGQTYNDTPVKLQVYQAILTYLGENNLQPTMISVEYPSAPFYRLKQSEQ
jgi:hypothetical protein